MSGGSVGEEHERGRCGPCAECRAASKAREIPAALNAGRERVAARIAEVRSAEEHTFLVRVDGSPFHREVRASTARDAAETFWRRRVMRGDATADEIRERVVVEHERGPEVDPSVTWHCEDGWPFAVFVVRVLDVQVAAEVAP